MTVLGVVVYSGEYQEHSDAAEAAWRQQDKEEEEKEEEDKKKEVAGAAFHRILCESMLAVDAEIEAYDMKERAEKEEEEKRRRRGEQGTTRKKGKHK